MPFGLTRLTCLLLGLLAVCCQGRASELIDIRTGFHRDFSRVVLQFDSRVEFEIVKDAARQAILVEVQPVDKITVFWDVPVDRQDPYLREVRYLQAAHYLSVTALLQRANLSFTYYTLHRPFRIVLDVYPERLPVISQAAPPVSLAVAAQAVAAADSVQRDSLSVTGDAQTLAPQPELMSPDTTALPFGVDFADKIDLSRYLEVKPSSRQPATAPAGPATGKKMLMLVVLLGAFLLLDVILLTSYLVKRSLRRKPALRSPAGQKSALPQPGSNEFVEVLVKAMQSDQEAAGKNPPVKTRNDELDKIESAVKIDNMIEALSKAVKSRKLPFTLPDLDEILQELDLSDDSARISRELLMGRDGQEFVRNLKRLSLN